MELILDIGNSRTGGGIYQKGKLLSRFNRESEKLSVPANWKTLFTSLFKEDAFIGGEIDRIGCSSVVPRLNASLTEASRNHFRLTPFFVNGGGNTGLKILTKNPEKVGADRIAAAAGAVEKFPEQNILVADLGTATTLDGINGKGEFLGGMIMAGGETSQKALQKATARLPSVKIGYPHRFCGKDTEEAIRSGLFLMQLGAIKEGVERLTKECFPGESVTIIGTGGLAPLFERENIFTQIIPDLVLDGISLIEKRNR
jgi:type III pantothenate kinase